MNINLCLYLHLSSLLAIRSVAAYGSRHAVTFPHVRAVVTVADCELTTALCLDGLSSFHPKYHHFHAQLFFSSGVNGFEASLSCSELEHFSFSRS